MCIEKSTVLRAVAVDFIFLYSCVDTLSDNRETYELTDGQPNYVLRYYTLCVLCKYLSSRSPLQHLKQDIVFSGIRKDVHP